MKPRSEIRPLTAVSGLFASCVVLFVLTGCGGASPAATVTVLPPQGIAFDTPMAVGLLTNNRYQIFQFDLHGN